MDLPTYTNIWRIEKRLYKLYDFRLPAPLPITWIGVFAGITVPYVFFLIAVGLPFNHNLVWLYVLPPGVLTWLTTRPVIESKRLPELVSSQLRYVSEPRTWCRMAPFAEKDEIMVSARVWHRHPPKKAKKSPAKARSGAPARQASDARPARAGTRPARAGVRVPRPPRTAAKPLATAQPLEAAQPLETAQPLAAAQQMAMSPLAGPPPEAGAVSSPVQVPERTPARRAPKRPQNRPAAEPGPVPAWPSWPLIPEPGIVTGPAGRETGTVRPSVWTTSPAAERAGTRPLEVAHDSDPVLGTLSESSGPTAWPSAEANLLPLVRALPAPAPFPEAGAFPEVDLDPEPDAGPAADGSPAAGWDPAADEEYNGGSGARSGAAAGPARRHLAGLRHGLGRKADRPAGPFSPPAEDAAPVAPAWPQPPASLAKARARWMLRAQPRPAQASPAPAGLSPAPPAPETRAAETRAAETPAAETPVPGTPVPGTPVPETPVLEAAGPETMTEAPRDSATPETQTATPDPEAEAETDPEPEAEPAEAETREAAVVDATAVEATVVEAQAVEAAVPDVEATREEAGEAEREAHEVPASSHAEPAPSAARFVAVERERPLPSIERALSGPGSRGDASSWRRQVKVVAGGQGPGRRDQEALDRDRARMPLAAPSRIAVLGCTRGAGQTVTTLMAGHILAAVRGIPVAALDLNPGPTSLATRHAPAITPQALLAGREPGPPDPPELLAGPGPGARLDVVAGLPGHGLLEGADFGRLADLLTERYSLTMIDPSPSGLTRVLAAADQLILVAPASPDAATSLANTQQWLGAHGHGELAARAVTVVNGVSRRTMEDVLRAESVVRGRCRAIVRVPWDDCLAARSGSPAAEPSPATQSTQRPQSTQYPQVALQPQARLAYTALAGVLVAALSAGPASGRNPGEHSD